MIKTEILLLANNIITPYQDFGLDFVELNKLFATQSLAEHGLGFLITIYDWDEDEGMWGSEILEKIIFDTGSTNHTFMHNLNVRGYSVYDATQIILSHWHYDHTGGLYGILEEIEDEIPVYCHDSARFERFFRRSKGIRNADLVGKKREEIVSLLSEMKLVNQAPINEDKVKELNGRLILTSETQKVFSSSELNIYLTGEIPRTHKEEDFKNFFSLQDGVLKEDKILDDKCLIFEYKDNAVVLNGCCHSGLMNTLDKVKTITAKPVSHIIGGFHMASASDERIDKTIDYLRDLEKYNEKLYLFPIHCSGDKVILEINGLKDPKLMARNASVGSMFHF